MIKNIYVTSEGCSGLGQLEACLDYPLCGYHDDNAILIAGWVLPLDPISNDVQVIVKVEGDLKPQEFRANKVLRSDVFKAKRPNIQYPTTAMKIGFSIRIPFQNSTVASLIVVANGKELLWYKLKIIVEDEITSFVNQLTQSTAVSVGSISVDTIAENTRIYFPHTLHKSHKTLINTHLNRLRNAVISSEYIVSLYKSNNGLVSCPKSDLKFEICKSKTINENVFLFCKDEDRNLFVIHQHVTSIDGIYYPMAGIYYSFCHGSQERLVTLIKSLIGSAKNFHSNTVKETAFLIGHSRPYHFLYDGMLGLEQIYQNVYEVDDAVLFYTLENDAFLDAPKVFNRNKNAIIINNSDLINLEQKGVLFIKIGALFGSGACEQDIYKKIDSLDKRIRNYAWGLNSHGENITSDLKKHFPIIWIGVTGQKRVWLEQIEGYSNIINKLYEHFPRMAVIFDGWTSALIPLPRDKFESDKDRMVINEILGRITGDIKVVDLIGATIDKKVYMGSFVDGAIVNYSTGSMNVSRICGRPSVTHMNNSFAPARHQHIHKNVYEISEEYVADVQEEGCRIDSTSYHINWEHIYDSLISHLGLQDIINNRR